MASGLEGIARTSGGYVCLQAHEQGWGIRRETLPTPQHLETTGMVEMIGTVETDAGTTRGAPITYVFKSNAPW